MGLKSTAGEIVQVQGGHIIRATGRKDRHSKVFTAKGPRDRRVRLSAHTAIQFYDVQDRLGYDRPSKAVDWLIKKAKASIDKLAELPPWDPTATAAGTSAQVDANVGTSDHIPVGDEHTGPSSAYYVTAEDNSVSLSDSMKSFFPATSSGEHHQINFQNYPQGLMSRSSNLNNHHNQDLGLSLHTSLQDHEPNTHQNLFQGSGSALGFDIGGSSGWSEPSDMARFTRMMGWSSGGGGGSGGERMFFNSAELAPQQQQQHQQALLLGQQAADATATVAYSQRGTLQSSLSHSVRAMEDDHNYHSSHHQQHHQGSISGIGHHGSDSFMGFCLPSQLHGHHHELHGGGGSLSNRASSSSLSPDSSQH